MLPPLPDNAPPNRLGLARWLVDRDNPLTARVTVNRFWEQFFGRGLVETSEDFGTQGSRPSHQDLLDWLAVEFMERGWSMKTLHKLIVTSATYRQSSHVTPTLLQRDPYNRLLARGPRFRLEGEMIRDVTLSAAGLLSPKIGGPSVYPPQPDGIWNVSRSNLKWETSQGEDRYRRAIYTFLRRTSPYPRLTTFDGTSREACTIRRVRTNTPLQALTLLNDPAFFEAAQALGQRIVKEAPPDPRSRAAHGFRLAVGRSPSDADLRDLLAVYENERQRTGRDDAAWTAVSNVLLNLDETQTKE